MIFRKFLFVLLSGITLTAASFSFYHTEKFQETPLSFPKGSTYEKEWKRVDSLTGKGLTRSALEITEAILRKAKQENNAAQVAKALIHKLKFESYIEEESYIKAINDLQEEVDSSAFPLRPVLHSVLADVYWGYYQQNRWKFLNRTETAGFKPNDIRTWDLKKLLQETVGNYELSLKSADSLKRTSIALFEPILHREKESQKYRPSLYDFLAHRAVDFFMHDEASLTAPAYKFELDKAEYFLPSEKFSLLEIETRDTLALKYHAVTILRDLLKTHLPDAEPSALIDADLKRLKFLKSNSNHESKDSLYLSALENLEKKYSVHPSSAEIAYEIAGFHFEKGNVYDPPEKEEGKFEKKKAAEICRAAIARFPGSHGANNCKYLLARIEEKTLSFTAENANAPDQPFRALLKYKNLKRVYFRVASVNYDDYKNLAYKKYGKQLMDNLKSLKPVKEWSLDLPDDGDFQQHSAEIKIPELPFGYYIILCGSDEKFDYSENGVAYGNCWISNLSYTTRYNTRDGSYDVQVFHRTTGAPLKDVTAELFYQKYNYVTRDYNDHSLGKYTTDENGYFNVPASSDYRNFFLDFRYKEDRLNTNSYLYQYRPYRDEKKRIVTHFFTDRAIYRPGQTVYFKGIVIEADGEKTEIKTNFNTTVVFNDVNYQKVSELKLTTNEYGSFSGTFTAPVGVLNGQMHITNQFGYVYFSVEEYKRPKFEVTFDKVKGSYKLNEEVKVKGLAKAYSGSVIDGAEVKYRVVRNANFPYWYGFWRGGYPSSPQMEIAHGVANTDEKGEFEISFNAIPDKKIDRKYQPTFTYTVSADVTDINGETHSGQQSVSAAYSALLIKTDIPAELNKNERDTFLLQVTNLAGEEEPAQGNATVYKLKSPGRTFRKRLWERPGKFLMTKEEFYAAFPKDAYDNENDYHGWEKGEKVFDQSFNTGASKKLTLLGLPSWQQGYYVLEAKTRDKFGEEVKEIKYFTLFSPEEKTVPSDDIAWFAVLKDKGEPGEKAAFLVGSRENNVKMLYEIEHKGVIVAKEWISLSNEQKKIEIPIEEKHRGNFAVHFLFVKDSRVYNYDKAVTVPHTDKMLDVEFETFRNKLLPGQTEEWKIKIKDKKGEKAAAEMLVSMYDASLDAFRANNWYFNILSNYYSTLNWQIHQSFTMLNSQLYFEKWNVYPQFFTRYYDRLNWFDFYLYSNNYRYGYLESEAYYDDMDYSGNIPASRSAGEGKNSKKMMARKVSGVAAQTAEAGSEVAGDAGVLEEAGEKTIDGFISDETLKDKEGQKKGGLSAIKARSNFAETAFFYPHLETNEKGEIIIKFTVPEALTKWKFSGLAHSKDLKSGVITKEVITQKELMVTPNAPRFFREGDKISFTAKISNLSENDLGGKAELLLYDATNMKEITSKIMLALHGKFETIGTRDFSAKKGQSAVLNWELSIPDNYSAITYKVVAKAGNFSDGEEMALPVLTNRMLVTESMPLPVKGKQKKDFRFEKLINSANSSTLKNHKLTLEFTANPAWYAVQALPYLMEYPYECSEQVFNRFYANSIASHIANSSPKIKAVFDSWKSQSPEALLSNLEKNQELKSLVLEETPWVLDAKDESERKKRIALLFDLNKMSRELESAIQKLEKMQTPNGGWTWFPGMPDSRYITQYIVTGVGHLEKLGIKSDENKKIWNMVQKAVPYLDDRLREDYEWLKRQKVDMSKNHLGYMQVQYLYARSYFIDRIEVSSKNKEAFNYYKGQAQKFWLDNNRYMQGMIALGLHRMKDAKTPQDIVKSLKENAIFNEELGMYWKEFSGGLYWYEAPIEAQALFIETFNEISKDIKSVNEMRVWLLKNKQTNDWKTTKATSEACYALLLNGTDWLATESNVEITVGELKIDPEKMDNVKVEEGTGYFKTSWSGNEIKTDMGKVTVTKNDEGVSWGALYWQYFEQLDKITPHETPLKLNKKLFLEKMSDTGPIIAPVDEKTVLKPGDKIKVRIELRVDRDMEFVQMKDMRASGLEPINVLSHYKWQDGLGYYESTRDAATNFFFDYLPKGTYVFEYPLRVTHEGDFSNGITTIQCMYAPEFASHSEGVRVRVGN